MFEAERIEEWRGADVYDVEGERIGKLDDLFEDRQTGKPAIGSVKTGLLGRKLSLVPLEGATVSRSYLRVDATKEQVKGAPQAESGDQLDDAAAGAVFSHYGREVPIGAPGDGQGGPRFEASKARENREAEAKEKADRAAALEAEAARERERAESAAQTAESSTSAASDAESESERLRREAAELRGEAAPPSAPAAGAPSAPPQPAPEQGASGGTSGS